MQKRKNALESVLLAAESGDPENADPARLEFHKFLRRQGEHEYKAKLGKLRQIKKAQMTANEKGSPGRKQRKRLSGLHK